MTQTEALKLALEALESATPKYARQRKNQKELGGYLEYWKLQQHKRGDAIFAIKEALAQQELCKYGQEPKSCTSSPMDCQCAIDATLAQPEQEPVAWMRHDGARVTTAADRKNYPDYETRYSVPLYTTPPQRKPLTDEEIGAILEGVNAYGTRLYTFARAIEAKLKEKNAK